jgi:hypothetical protein
MKTIITGHFQQQSTARQAVAELLLAGFSSDKTAIYYLNPAGQHDLHRQPGGDHESPGSDDAAAGAAMGAAAGGAVGVAVGLAGLPVLGPSVSLATAGLGAYVGSLYGALATMHGEGPAGTGTTGNEGVGIGHPRRAGMLVAVSAPAAGEQQAAIRIFGGLGATDIDRPQGEIVGGEWIDFDLSAPLQIVPGSA